MTDVVVSGCSEPFLEGQAFGGKVALTLDNRFGLELTREQAQTVVPFLADAIAIALGYPSHPSRDTALADPVRRQVAPRPPVCFEDDD
jgi:hypothetical protein